MYKKCAFKKKMYKKCITTQHLQFQPITTDPSFNFTDALVNIISRAVFYNEAQKPTYKDENSLEPIKTIIPSVKPLKVR